MLTKLILDKNQQLGEILMNMNKVLVAFSGGVDSSLVLKRARDILGKENVLAVVVDSELFREEEFIHAVELAEAMDVNVLKTNIHELDDERIVANSPESWYFSKKLLYNHLNEKASELGYDHVLDGMIMDDVQDFRPGLRARSEAGVRSVLQEADLYKDEVRLISKEIDLPVWDKPASCSLASRIPYGIRLDKEKISQVKEAERLIRELGFEVVRVRHHGDLARIEIDENRITEIFQYKELINSKLKELGFQYISIDLEGYRTGSMNEALADQNLNEELI